MNTVINIGTEAAKFVGQLAAERDATSGNVRLIRDGDVKLDSVKAWERTEPTKPIIHEADGSMVEIVYGAYKKPTERQILEAEGAVSAGVDRKLISGRIVDVKNLNGDVILLVTTGFRRKSGGGVPLRLLNVTKGKLYAIAINGSLGKTAEEVKALYGVSSAPTPTQPIWIVPEAVPVAAPAAPVAVPATSNSITVPSAPAPTPVKKHKLT